MRLFASVNTTGSAANPPSRENYVPFNDEADVVSNKKCLKALKLLGEVRVNGDLARGLDQANDGILQESNVVSKFLQRFFVQRTGILELPRNGSRALGGYRLIVKVICLLISIPQQLSCFGIVRLAPKSFGKDILDIRMTRH